MTSEQLKDLIEDLRLNHEFCPKEVILQSADELERIMGDRQLIEDLLSALKQEHALHDLARLGQEIEQAEPTCPECKAKVLFECVACSSNNYPPQQQAEPPLEWLLIKNILDEYGLDAIAFVAEWKAAQQQAEPVQERITRIAWDERGVRTVNGIPDDAPQRPWQGLTDGDWEWVADKKETSLDTFAHGAAWAADQLKERNTILEYTKRPWVGLTPEEILDLFDLNNVYGSKWIEFARTVEAALRSKNT